MHTVFTGAAGSVAFSLGCFNPCFCILNDVCTCTCRCIKCVCVCVCVCVYTSTYTYINTHIYKPETRCTYCTYANPTNLNQVDCAERQGNEAGHL